MTNYIIFPVGDWSGDGHSCCADFLVKSDKSLEEVREVHFKENSFIGSLCEEYDDNKINIHFLYLNIQDIFVNSQLLLVYFVVCVNLLFNLYVSIRLFSIMFK